MMINYTVNVVTNLIHDLINDLLLDSVEWRENLIKQG